MNCNINALSKSIHILEVQSWPEASSALRDYKTVPGYTLKEEEVCVWQGSAHSMH